MATRYGQQRHLKGYGVGTILPWSGASDTIPAGWLPCTGGTRNAAEYPMLYDIIGNTYGGTAGSTFGLPPLLNGRAISDTYEGHFTFLQAKDDCHWEPKKVPVISQDPFWKQIDNDTGNTEGAQTGNSTADLVVEYINGTNKPDLVATVKEIEFEPGGVSIQYGIHPRSLSDRHESQSAHNHGLNAGLGDQEPPNSFNMSSAGKASKCKNKTSGCKAANTGCHETNTPGNRHVLSSSGGCVVKGGSTGDADQTGMNNDGDGQVGGDMYAKQTGGSGALLATSLSNDASTRSWSNINGHIHTYAGADLNCNVGIQGSYTFYDIDSNGLDINDAPGVNVASININTATPNLTMMFIIKAY